jgi:hypothetical protein
MKVFLDPHLPTTQLFGHKPCICSTVHFFILKKISKSKSFTNKTFYNNALAILSLIIQVSLIKYI